MYDHGDGGLPVIIRRRAWFLVLVVSAAVLLCIRTPAAHGGVQNGLDGADRAVYDSLGEIGFDRESSHPVRAGARWETPLGEYEFIDGRMAFLAPAAGRPTGCYFEGRARFCFFPEVAIEREQLRRFTGTTGIDATIERAFLRFHDTSDVRQVLGCVDTTIREPIRGVSQGRRFIRNVLNDMTIDMAAMCWRGIADGASSRRWLYACPEIPGERRLHFMLDTSEEEALSVWRPAKGATATRYADLVCSYDPPDIAADSIRRAPVLREGFDILHYETEVRIAGSGRVDLDVTMRCRLRNDGQQVLTFVTAPQLEVKSVAVQDSVAKFLYGRDARWLMVRTPVDISAGEEFSVRLLYRGARLMDKLPWGDYYIHHATLWLPRTTARQRTTYRTRFVFPKHYDLVSVGRETLDSIGRRERVSVWETYRPESYISFNYGSFERLIHEMDGGPVLEIYRGKNHLDGIFSGDFKRKVARELDVMVRLFSNLFSPYPWDRLAVTEIPGSHGQGFPQLLHLAWVSFDIQTQGVTDFFMAHEVAHQWFGHIVGWKSYHDQWLSEGFADYAGALYVQARHPGNEPYYRILRNWRERILSRGGHGYWHDGPGVAPIWLGFRAASYQSPASFSHLIYGKGAYVLHMLRYSMYDYESESDHRFLALMRDYVRRFAGRDASTEDFQALVEEHMGEPMGWFFDQWVYGTGIPRFEYRWQRVALDDGRWIVRGQIDQRDTDPPFQVDMPITVVTSRGRTSFLVRVSGARTEFESAPLEFWPSEVEFNDHLAVLCRERVVERP